jgi:hypothetical protein
VPSHLANFVLEKNYDQIADAAVFWNGIQQHLISIFEKRENLFAFRHKIL